MEEVGRRPIQRADGKFGEVDRKVDFEVVEKLFACEDRAGACTMSPTPVELHNHSFPARSYNRC